MLRVLLMSAYTFTVTINAEDKDTAREELSGGLEDSRDSGYIEDFNIVEGFDIEGDEK